MTTAEELLASMGMTHESMFFDKGRLLVDALYQAIATKHSMALTAEDRIAVYQHGVYRIEPGAFNASIAELLGDRFSRGHRDNVETYTKAMLYRDQKRLPTLIRYPLLNVANGMLDLVTGELFRHDPGYYSSSQIPVPWDPVAQCPTYETWTKEIIPNQVGDLEETVSTMLDQSRTPRKAIMLWGPSRSGKSTYLRIMQGMLGGLENGMVSAVTLQKLSTDRFAAANVYGKQLNCAADISSKHVEDLSIFKLLTGEDPVQGDRKFGNQFTFMNRALFAFSCNTLPTVGETSRAYVERIKPFHFSNSFAGHENPAIESAMMQELPGILVRWVYANQRLRTRGDYQSTDLVAAETFARESDRVAMWAAERCLVTLELAAGPVLPGMDLPPELVTSGRELSRSFNHWAMDQGSPPMGERTFLAKLRNVFGVVEVRNSGNDSRSFNVKIKPGF